MEEPPADQVRVEDQSDEENTSRHSKAPMVAIENVSHQSDPIPDETLPNQSGQKLLKEQGSETDLSEEFKERQLTEEDFEDFMNLKSEVSHQSDKDGLTETSLDLKVRKRKSSLNY